MKKKTTSFLIRIIHFFKKEPTKRKARITYDVIWNLTLVLSFLLVVGLCFGFGIGMGYFTSLVKDEPLRSHAEMEKQIYDYEETTELYFANNEFLGNARSDLEREHVALGDMSEHVKHAIISTEDEHFYEHSGVVPKAVLRAMFQEAANTSARSGGSTLTQQLIKNQVLTNEVSFERKAKEILLALRLETLFEKDEILEAYLNVVPFGRNSSGRNIAGIQTAAKGLFGINVKDVNLAQAAYLAGLPQNPYAFTPYTKNGEVKENIDAGLARMQTVLNRMHKEKFITDEQLQEAQSFDIKASLIPKQPSPFEQYPWLTMEIEKRTTEILAETLAKKDGKDLNTLKKDEKEIYKNYAQRQYRQNGYKVHTTIDKKIYDAMQQATQTFSKFGPNKSYKGESYQEETGAIMIDNKTGAILSFVGGRDFNKSQINHATQEPQQNGSTMKPLLVYAPALENGSIHPGTKIEDSLDGFKWPKGWNPGNANNKENGIVTIRDAIKHSYNIPAAKVYLNNASTKPISYLEKMGFTTLHENDRGAASLSLGGMSKGVTVEENVNAYTTFANGGKFIDAYMIEKIVDKAGNIIYQHESKPVEVFSPQTAYLTTDMMRDVMQGTAGSLNSHLNFRTDWAGKTGTSNNYYDLWFVATNPNVTFGTWLGYDKNISVDPSGHRRNLELWARLANAAYQVSPSVVGPKITHQMPSGIGKREICGISGLLPSEGCRQAGHVTNDYVNLKFLPTKADNTVKPENFVMINGKLYASLPTTPSEFIESKYKNSSLSIERSIEDGKNPSPVQGVTLSGNRLAWQANKEADVLGYYIYRDNKKVATIKRDSSLQTTIAEAGDYYVVAVDIAGKLSSPSNVVKIEKEDSQNEDNTDESSESNTNQ
ncbi:transglycosylase domain-containing protein [Priestia taiwanensis]|uniref:Peptidase n=1 Tax=Priestia taiwanensis TaxID=1347902 RepID=A0A917AUN1_9BACI|nr:transglycosylase domain-containing protein [Priestia taiwanensis]MBM7363421.1 penicillin-binding protein [Priestia taiwanensis]GGE77317.1 peptidase [Priestia taiwanensis]